MRGLAFLFSMYFLVLSIAPNMQGIQLLNLSQLVEHYYDFKSENANGTLLSFIKEHYIDKNTSFEKEHRNLPFKNVLHLPSINYCQQVKSIEFVLHQSALPKTKERPFVYSDEHLLKSQLFDIWTPPKLA
jgi:hypothetical protein